MVAAWPRAAQCGRRLRCRTRTGAAAGTKTGQLRAACRRGDSRRVGVPFRSWAMISPALLSACRPTLLSLVFTIPPPPAGSGGAWNRLLPVYLGGQPLGNRGSRRAHGGAGPRAAGRGWGGCSRHAGGLGAADSARRLRRRTPSGRPEAAARTPSGPDASLRRFYYDSVTHDADLCRPGPPTRGLSSVLLGSYQPFDMGNETCVDAVRALVLGAGEDLSGGQYERVAGHGAMAESTGANPTGGIALLAAFLPNTGSFTCLACPAGRPLALYDGITDREPRNLRHVMTRADRSAAYADACRRDALVTGQGSACATPRSCPAPRAAVWPR